MESLQTAVARRSLAYAQTKATATAEGSMNSLVRITRSGTWSETDYEYDPGTPQVIYDDPDTPGAGAMAGITPASGGSQLDLGDEPSYWDSVTVMIPQSAPTLPRIGDLVKVIASPDPDIVNRVFKVDSVPVGGRLYSSIGLTCSGVAPSRETTPAP